MGAFYFGSPRNSINSVAVLPFANAGGDPNTEYLSDGITEGVIDRLSGLPNLKVISRTSAFRYKQRDINPQKIAKELGVEALVTIQDKQNQGVTAKVIGKYTRELARLREFCESRSVFTVRGLTRELLTHYVATWPEYYPASITRSKVRERLRSFLRFCYQAEWLTRVPTLSKIAVDQAPTLPLSATEYDRLLDTVYATFADSPTKAARVHALIPAYAVVRLGNSRRLDSLSRAGIRSGHRIVKWFKASRQ